MRDAGLAALHQAVNAYARRVRAAGPNAVGFFYYAGHGAADAGTNYLIPVDVKSAEEGELWDRVAAPHRDHAQAQGRSRQRHALRGVRRLPQQPQAPASGLAGAGAVAEGSCQSRRRAACWWPMPRRRGSWPPTWAWGRDLTASVLAEEIVKPGVEAVTMFRNVQRACACGD